MSTDTFEIEALDQPTFTQVGHWVAFRSDLSPTARHLYTVLATFVNQGRRANGDTEVWPSLNLLAVTLGLSKGDSVTPYIDELIQANIVVKRASDIGGMRARNHYAIRFNPPPGEHTATTFVELLAPLKAIAGDTKAMSKAAKETRALIKERRERESNKRPRFAVPRNTGPRTPEYRGTHPAIPGSNKTQGELDGGLTTPPLLQGSGHAEREPAPVVAEKKTKKDTPETIVMQRLGCTVEEARMVVDYIEQQGDGRGGRIRSLTWWVTNREDRALAADLAQVRRHSAPPTVTVCGDHQQDMPPHGCALCAGEIKAGDPDDIARLRAHLAMAGEKARPDLARLLGAPQAAPAPRAGGGDVIDWRRMQKKRNGVVGGSRVDVLPNEAYNARTDEELRAQFLG